MIKKKRVLVDFSVWVSYFRTNDSPVAEAIDRLLDEDRVALCGMVELEILQGVREKEQANIQDLFQILYFIESKREDYVAAGRLLNQLRVKGITIPSSDCLIASQCLRCDFLLFTLDQDFRQIRALKNYTVLN